MKTWNLVATLIVVLISSVVAQDRDSARVSIHESEAEMHRWDSMKIHPSVPQLQLGAEMARRGDVAGAVRAFQKAAPSRPSMAYFNLGLLYFETGKLGQALRYFRLSYRARKDSVCLEVPQQH